MRIAFPLCLLCITAPILLASNLRFDRLGIDDGLSQSNVYSIVQDRFGYMWLGTQDGLNRYDGRNFRIYRNSYDDPSSISDNVIYALAVDADGSLWAGTADGLNLYVPERDSFVSFHFGEGASWVSHLLTDPKGDLWVGTFSDGIYQIQARDWTPIIEREDRNGSIDLSELEHVIHHVHDPDNSQSLLQTAILALYLDSGGRIWIGSNTGAVSYHDPQRPGRFVHFKPDSEVDFSILAGRVTSILEDRNGFLWVGARGGLSRMDLRRMGVFETYRHSPETPGSLPSNQVLSINQDSEGTLWVGLADSGLARYVGISDSFIKSVPEQGDLYSLSDRTVWVIYEDRGGIVWFGTYGGGVSRLDWTKQQFSWYRNLPQDPNSLIGNEVNQFAEDRRGRMWVATSSGVSMLATGAVDQFRNFSHDPEEPESLSNNAVWSVFIDSRDRLWVGTARTGLNMATLDDLDSPNPRFTRYRARQSSLSSDSITDIIEHDNRLWIATRSGGVNLMDMDEPGQFEPLGDRKAYWGAWLTKLLVDRSGQLWLGSLGRGLWRAPNPQGDEFIHYSRQSETSFRERNIWAIYQDQQGDIWAGGSIGLHRWRPEADVFETIDVDQEFPSNVIRGILEDPAGRLWLSTNRGIVRYSPATNQWAHYDADDGLQGPEFRANAQFRSSRGEFYFGGVNGFNRFLPMAVKERDYAPPVVLTQFLLDGKPQSPTDSESRLSKAMELTDRIVLGHKDLIVGFEFATLDFSSPKRNRYRYKLEPFNEDWIETDGQSPSAVYTNLNPGNYTFIVKGSNRSDIWSETPAEVALYVEAPPWRHPLAYTAYVLAVLTIVGLFLLAQRRKLAYERSVNERLTYLDKIKDQFLANTSHELRTPLNGIIGLTEGLVEGVCGPLPDEVMENLTMVAASGRRLAALVNDLLDLSLMQREQLNLTVKATDVGNAVQIVLTLMRPLLGSKKIQLIDRIPESAPMVMADENRLQQVLYNLIGNAVKFTKEGEISINAHREDEQLIVSIKDTGIGIDPNEDVFGAFVQVEHSSTRRHGGAGLGLTISRQIVDQHGGSLWYESTKGVGSEFFFSLPLAKEISETIDVEDCSEPTTMDYVSWTPYPKKKEESHDDVTFVVMVVDDDAINRQVLVNHLRLEGYGVVEAESGKAALRTLRTRMPDLILLDVMMPGLNGVEVCEKIRQTKSSSELPIIFLSAKTQIEDKIAGLNAGGNDYLGKPIVREELVLRVRTHLALLHVTRTLEQQVQARTQEIATKHQELIETHKELLEAAHVAGMAETATQVLHDVGNAVNSLRISLQLMLSSLGDQRWFAMLKRIEEICAETDGDLRDFFNEPSRSDKFKEAISRVVQGCERQQALIKDESGKLINQMEQLDYVLADQVKHAQYKPKPQVLDVNHLIRTVVEAEAYLLKNVDMQLDLMEPLPQAKLIKTKFTRVLTYLLENAGDAVAHVKKPRVSISSAIEHDMLIVVIQDNGVGIESDQLVQIFTQGYTTKEDARGAGLHYCANAITELNGTLQLHSDGSGRGARAEIRLPLNAK